MFTCETWRQTIDMTDIIDPKMYDKYYEKYGPKRALMLIESSQNSLLHHAEELKEGFATQDMDIMFRAVHSLKSTALNIGAGLLESMAMDMESRYLEGKDLSNEDPVKNLINLIEKTLEGIQNYLTTKE